jgi:hypothetical protein
LSLFHLFRRPQWVHSDVSITRAGCVCVAAVWRDASKYEIIPEHAESQELLRQNVNTLCPCVDWYIYPFNKSRYPRYLVGLRKVATSNITTRVKAERGGGQYPSSGISVSFSQGSSVIAGKRQPFHLFRLSTVASTATAVGVQLIARSSRPTSQRVRQRRKTVPCMRQEAVLHASRMIAYSASVVL